MEQLIVTLLSAGLICGAYFARRRQKIFRRLLFAGFGACLGVLCRLLVAITVTHLIPIFPSLAFPPYLRLIDFALDATSITYSVAGAAVGGLFGFTYGRRNAA